MIIYQGSNWDVPGSVWEETSPGVWEEIPGGNPTAFDAALMADIPAVRNNSIVRIDGAGAAYWFEGRPAEPDVLVLDMIHSIYPSSFAASIVQHDKVFLRNHFLDAPGTFPTCADPSKPLYTNWLDGECASAGNPVVIQGEGGPQDPISGSNPNACVVTVTPTSSPTRFPTVAPTPPTQSPTSAPVSCIDGVLALNTCSPKVCMSNPACLTEWLTFKSATAGAQVADFAGLLQHTEGQALAICLAQACDVDLGLVGKSGASGVFVAVFAVVLAMLTL